MLLSPMAFAKDVANNLDNDLKCIVKTVLAEGENQSRNAKVGIMYTIKNRVKLSHKSYCSVVNAKNQFSHRIVKIIPKKHKQIPKSIKNSLDCFVYKPSPLFVL